MISVVRPVTAEEFRRFFERRLEYLFTDCPHPGFSKHFAELNQMILFAQADGLTQARQFSGDELMDMEAELVVLDMTRFQGLAAETWQKFISRMEALGLSKDLLPAEVPQVCR